MARLSKQVPTSLLDTLTVASGPVKLEPKTKKPVPVHTNGLKVYAALAKVASEITNSFLKTSPVRDIVLDHMTNVGKIAGRVPDNYHGSDDDVTASLQLRRKDSRTKLSPEIVEQFSGLGIRTTNFVNRVKSVIVNPNYMQEKNILEKLLKMAKDAGFPEDFFQLQAEDSYDIVSEDTVNDIFALAKSNKIDDDTLVELLNASTSITISPKWNGSFAEAFTIVQHELLPDPKPLREDLTEKLQRSLVGEKTEKARRK